MLVIRTQQLSVSCLSAGQRLRDVSLLTLRGGGEGNVTGPCCVIQLSRSWHSRVSCSITQTHYRNRAHPDTAGPLAGRLTSISAMSSTSVFPAALHLVTKSFVKWGNCKRVPSSFHSA